jgi:hypothetical protein
MEALSCCAVSDYHANGSRGNDSLSNLAVPIPNAPSQNEGSGKDAPRLLAACSANMPRPSSEYCPGVAENLNTVAFKPPARHPPRSIISSAMPLIGSHGRGRLPGRRGRGLLARGGDEGGRPSLPISEIRHPTIYQILPSGRLNHAKPPSTQAATMAVKIPAPARSFVVTFIFAVGSSADGSSMPVFGLPTLVPPVLFVRGERDWPIMVLCTASSAAICWPTPYVPSQLPFLYQLRPHMRPLGRSGGEPEHCSAAAEAEVLITAMTAS